MFLNGLQRNGDAKEWWIMIGQTAFQPGSCQGRILHLENLVSKMICHVLTLRLESCQPDISQIPYAKQMLDI